MRYMFRNAVSFSQPLGWRRTVKHGGLSLTGMFEGATAFDPVECGVQDLAVAERNECNDWAFAPCTVGSFWSTSPPDLRRSMS